MRGVLIECCLVLELALSIEGTPIGEVKEPLSKKDDFIRNTLRKLKSIMTCNSKSCPSFDTLLLFKSFLIGRVKI